MIPQHTDIIIPHALAMNRALDRIPIIINHENHRREPKPDIAAYLLHRHLQRAVADDQYDSAAATGGFLIRSELLFSLLLFFGGGESTETGADCVADRGPERLRDQLRVRAKGGVR